MQENYNTDKEHAYNHNLENPYFKARLAEQNEVSSEGTRETIACHNCDAKSNLDHSNQRSLLCYSV